MTSAEEQMTKTGQLYDRDFVRWTEEQAAALRAAKSLPPTRTGASNLPLDWENLAEEIESLGKSDRRALRSQTRRILHHLFKLDASPATEPRAGWRATIRDARSEIDDVLRDSPSLRGQVGAMVTAQLGVAAALAEDDFAQHAESVEKIRARLDQGGFTAAQVLGDWFPDPPG